MALTVDATAASGYPASHPITWSHVVGGGANRLLVVGVVFYGATPPTISSVKYGGVTLSQAALNSDAPNSWMTAIYYLIAPATGTANVVVTLSGTAGSYAGFSISFTGADQTTPIDVTQTQAFVNNANYTENITTLAADAYLVDAVIVQFTGTAGTDTPGGGQTAILNVVDGPGFSAAGGSYKSVPGAAGAKSLTWSATHTDTFWLSAWASVQPVSAGGTSPSKLLMLGVG